MHAKWMMLIVHVISIGLCSSAPTPPAEGRDLSERIAFACEHKPTLSFCSPNNEPTIHVANDRITPQPEAPRRNDSPTPKRRIRWVFVPNSGDSRFWNDVANSARTQPKSRKVSKQPLLIIPPEPFHSKPQGSTPTRALQSRTFPVLPSDAAYGAGQLRAADGNPFAPFSAFDQLTDQGGLAHRPRSRSPFTKPGLWEPNPDDPHSRDPANKWWYRPESVGVDWLNGQAQWGGHWAVPAAGVGGTNGQSALHFPTLGTFLGIPDDYD